MQFKRHVGGAALCLLLATASPLALAQYVPLVGGTPAIQTFDTLAASGTGTAVPDGWYFVETGANANTSYAADDGNSNSGNTYSYGSSGSSDRAFGSLLSGNLKPSIGVQLRNESGNALTEIAVVYTGEQWRLGVAGRTDRLKAQYSLDATQLGNGTWIDVPALDFISPNTTAAPGKLDGNLAANRTTVSGSITGLNLAVNGTVWLRWVDNDVSGIDDGLAIDDISFAVAGDPPVDLPPTVTATSPANNAVDVALAASLSVSFSEAVTVTAPWFTLSCSASGNHAASVTGGPSTYTLTPTTAFAANETCTWTILASGVVDQDGTPDPLAANHVVTFTTIDPATAPPSVVSTQPANGASNVAVASDLLVTFNEAVTTTSAFTLACNATPIPLDEAGSGAARTLTPHTVLPESASCTFTILAAGVRNAANINMAANVTVTFQVTSGSNDDYYSQVNTSAPDQLRCSLHATIRDHTVYPYSASGTSTWTILELADASIANPERILDVYRNRLYVRGTDRAGSGGSNKYNREHTWPNSLGFGSATGDLGLPHAPYTDTHMLYLSDEGYNSNRGNMPYASCPKSSGCSELTTEANQGAGGSSGGVYPGNSNWFKGPNGPNGSFEPWAARKGDMARAIMYMAIRYEGGVDARGQTEPNLELTDDRAKIGTGKPYMGLLTDLLAWHLADPPSAEEQARNELIFTFQGNRNPFIDHPEWGTRALFESVTPAVCELTPPADNDIIFANGFDSPN